MLTKVKKCLLLVKFYLLSTLGNFVNGVASWIDIPGILLVILKDLNGGASSQDLFKKFVVWWVVMIIETFYDKTLK